MKLLILTILLAFCGITYAQEVKPIPYEYAELLGYEKMFSRKITLVIDFGQHMSAFKNQKLRDEESGKVAKFNSMVDAMNYMGQQGWEFVQAYAISHGSGGSAQNVYHWLMKRPISETEKTPE